MSAPEVKGVRHQLGSQGNESQTAHEELRSLSLVKGRLCCSRYPGIGPV